MEQNLDNKITSCRYNVCYCHHESWDMFEDTLQNMQYKILVEMD